MFIVACHWPLIPQRLIEIWNTVKVLGLSIEPVEAAPQLYQRKESESWSGIYIEEINHNKI